MGTLEATPNTPNHKDTQDTFSSRRYRGEEQRLRQQGVISTAKKATHSIPSKQSKVDAGCWLKQQQNNTLLARCFIKVNDAADRQP